MTRVIDTSAWIEWLIGSAIGRIVARTLPERESWIVPTIVQLELAKWLTREIGEDKADQVIAFTDTRIVVPLDTPIALSAADLCRRLKLATADAIIYATALALQAELVTCDHHFSGLPGVLLISKAS